MTIALIRHPASPTAAATAITVEVKRDAEKLLLRYALDAAADRLRIPAAGSPRFAIGLWRHTCFEAFVAVDGERAYHEWNFSPSRAWAVHAFQDVRDGGPVEDERFAPELDVRTAERGLVLEARVDLARLSAAHAGAGLRLALAAVVESSGGGLEYWALRHPAAKPDFHHPDSFALALEA